MTAVTENETQPRTNLVAGTVFWAWIHGEDVRAAFMSSVIATIHSPYAQYVGSFFDQPSGPLLSLARNTCAEAFLESGQDWLWFVDSDTVFIPRTIAQLLCAADPETRPVVSAAVPIARGRPEGGYFGVPELGWSAFREGPGGELEMISARESLETVQEVAAVGCGCLLIHRSVLEAIGPGPFNEESNGKFIAGEDVAFCRRATAKGFPVHVAGFIKVGHAKVVTL